MKRLLFILALFFHFSQAQNLVPNPSFEEDTVCPKFDYELCGVKKWRQPSWGTSDYYNVKFNSIFKDLGVPYSICGFQRPKTGIAYAGLLYYSSGIGMILEYLQVDLNDSLKKDEEYTIELYISISDKTDKYNLIGDLDIMFTKKPFFMQMLKYEYENESEKNVSLITESVNLVNESPRFTYKADTPLKDSTNWILVKGMYKANGGEKVITIGNFTKRADIEKYVIKRKEITFDKRKVEVYKAYIFLDDVLIMKKTDYDSLENAKYLQSIKDKKTRLQVYNYYKLSNTKDTSCFNEIKGMRELVVAIKKDEPNQVNLFLSTDIYLLSEQDWLCRQEEFNWLQSFLQKQFPHTKINTYCRNANGETLSNDTQEGIYYNHSVWVEW